MTFIGFALFMGTAMSITAFPVLARILAERQLVRTPIGALAIACAAIDDVTAWCILAAVVVIVRATGGQTGGSAIPLWITLAGSVALVGLMMTVVRRALRALETRYAARGKITQDTIAVLMLTMLASAFVTERLGIPAVASLFRVHRTPHRSDAHRRG